MYVGIAEMEVDPSDEARAESLRIIEQQQLPLIRSAPGFLHQIVAARADDRSRVVVIGLWESEQAARRWESSGDFQKAGELFGPLIRTRPQRTLYEVFHATLGLGGVDRSE